VKFRAGRRRPRLAELSLTPLLDIVFNLLVFFLLSATFAERAAIDVDLPDSDETPAQPGEHDVVVVVSSDGTVQHLDRIVNGPQLEARLARHHDKHPRAAVIVDADINSRHGLVVEVMRIARRVGFTDVAIAADPKR
jgi:biopolymer transport protein ExbD